jgi:hypothetical protein
MASTGDPLRDQDTPAGQASGAPVGVDGRAPLAHRAVGVAFMAGLVVLAAGYLVFAVPGKWIPSHSPEHLDAGALSVVSGTGSIDRGELAVSPQVTTQTVVVSASIALRAADFPGVTWEVSGLPPGTEARLLWHNTFAPARVFSRDIPVQGAELAPVVVRSDPNWTGRVTGIALAMKVPSTKPVRIAGVTLQTLSAYEVLAQRAHEWLTLETWSGTSINTVVGGAAVPELPLPVLLGLSTVIASLTGLLIAAWRPLRFGPGLPTAIATVFLAAWVLLDARWQWNLARQVRATGEQYAGKTWREKHLASEDDGPLFAFIEQVRAKLPAQPARVFVLADADYFRGRAAYHLYPHNVYFNPWVIPAASVRANDYFVVYLRKNVAYDDAQQSLRWDNGPPVGADILLAEPGAALFRIR